MWLVFPVLIQIIHQTIDRENLSFRFVVMFLQPSDFWMHHLPTAFFHLGNLVEYGETGQIFTNPQDSRTESYITGRIG